MNILTTAQQYAAAGISVIPVRTDGSKAPALPAWKEYERRLPTPTELCRWFQGHAHGIALVNGAVSGDLETLDFDEAGLYEKFEAAYQEQQRQEQQGDDLLVRLPLVETPSGGRHLLYRCTEPVSGNQKLAQRLIGSKIETLIETRGEGGYIVAAGSPVGCHPAGTPYRFLRGSVASLPRITPKDRRLLLTLAALFNEYVKPGCVRDAPPSRLRREGNTSRLMPGEDYNDRGDYEVVLIAHGWRHLRDVSDKRLWQRPGKTGPGLSATSNYAGRGLFYVFSANAAPFEPQTAYSPFAVYTWLEHGGDFSNAARALVADGYGDKGSYGEASSGGASLPPNANKNAPGGNSALTGVSASPAPRKTVADRIVDLADVEAPSELPLLFGQYLLKGHQHWLTGQTSIGKSTLIYNLATSLAEGKALWGIACPQTTVLYVDTESGDLGRAHKVERLYQGAAKVRGRLLFAREPLRLPEELPDLMMFIRERGVNLVIFDTARRCFSVRDENDNAEVYNRVVPILDALKLAGVASLTMGHPPKNGGAGARGAGAQEDAGDVNLTLTMHRGDIKDKDGVIALQVTKNRLLGMGIPPLYLRRVGNDHFEPLADAEAGPEPKTLSTALKCREVVLRCLVSKPESQTAFSELLAAALEEGLTKTTLHRTLKELEEQAEVMHTPRGGYRLFDPFAE